MGFYSDPDHKRLISEWGQLTAIERSAIGLIVTVVR